MYFINIPYTHAYVKRDTLKLRKTTHCVVDLTIDFFVHLIYIVLYMRIIYKSRDFFYSTTVTTFKRKTRNRNISITYKGKEKLIMHKFIQYIG